MSIQITGQTTIFKNDKGFYSTGISNKLMDGSYDNAYISVQFKRGIEVENKSKINIKNGFLSFWKGQDGKPSFKIIVLDFTTDGDAKEDTMSTTNYTPDDLPF